MSERPVAALRLVCDTAALLPDSKAELFEMRNLAIGKTAPDIVGQDVDGKTFKLSHYRGKVVVIDFWGDW